MTNNVDLKDLYELQEKMNSKLSALEAKVDSKFVSRVESDLRFRPIEDDLNRFKNLLYGTIATLIALIVAAIAGGKLL